MASSRPVYCLRSQVLARLYAGLGTVGQNPGGTGDTNRDAFIDELIAAVSRRFDDECARDNPGAFSPTYAARLFSGRGAMVLETDEFARAVKVEYNATTGRTPSWVDVTADLAAATMAEQPPNVWPKTKLWRVATFVTDPYREVGNIRLTGVFGCVQPDLGATVPTVDGSGNINDPLWPSFAGVALTSVQPLNGVGTPAGWWIVPEVVSTTVASWVVYCFQGAKAGYADVAGSPQAATMVYSKGVPKFVQDVIDRLTERRMHLAMITTDGADLADSQVYGQINGSPDQVSRWASWQTQ